MATQLADATDEPIIANDADAPEPRDYEAEARVQGWRPKEEYTGPPEKWSDAEAFVKHGEEILPRVLKDLKATKAELASLKRQLKRRDSLDRKAQERTVAELEARQEAAVETGDVAEHRRIKAAIRELQTDLDDEPEAPGGEDPREQYEAFREANIWYDKANLASATETEIEARLYADRLADQWVHQGKDKELPPSEFFAQIGEAVATKFPLLKTRASRARPESDVAGVTRGAVTKAKTGANLPPEAKEEVRKWMRTGAYKNMTFEQASNAFAKDYFTE